MNVNQAISSIVDQITIFKPAMSAEYFVIYREKLFLLTDYRPMNQNIPIITRLTRKDINEGLMSPGWDDLTSKVANFIKLNRLNQGAN